jgi:hypothetical protein
MLGRLRSFLAGLRDMFAFSNAALLLMQRLFYRCLPLVYMNGNGGGIWRLTLVRATNMA